MLGSAVRNPGMCLLTSQHREVTSFYLDCSFPTDKLHSGWLAAAFLIQHASAVILCLFAVLISVCVVTRGYSNNMKVCVTTAADV